MKQAIWLALALVVVTGGCAQESATLRLRIGAEADVGGLERFMVQARVGTGDAVHVSKPHSETLGGRDLGVEPFELGLTLPEGSAFDAPALVIVLGYKQGQAAPVASALAEADLAGQEAHEVTLLVVASGCDADGDGYKDCEQKPECCTASEKAEATDCDDGDPDANPFADTKACRTCSAVCGEAEGDGSAEVVEPGPDASDVVDAKDADDTDWPPDTETLGEVIEVVDTLVELDGTDADMADADVPEVCTPECVGKVCGPDGCGGSCGTCAGARLCEQGACVCPEECSPSGKKECVDDTHYRTCGDLNSDDCLEWTTSPCTEGDTCHDEGICDCTPSCAGKECGDNGCGGSCGGCTNGKTCEGGLCECAGSTDDDCNSVDDDCDGQTDEGYGTHATACGVGACKATGSRTCVDGVETDSCTPGLPAVNDMTCNNVDDDCDGSTDEDYPGVTTTCGKGACAATGKMSCVGGTESNSCVAGTAGVETATCDGVDNDCDGQTDEGYVADTTCGVGYCKTHNTPSTCLNGVVTECAPGAKLSTTDATCDGVDDDCSGQTDEDYAPVTSCFKPGACSTGNVASSCSGGVVTACKTGTPAANDATCDGVDDDCSGAADEDYVAITSCYKPGACAAQNAASKCVAGVETACKTGTPAASDATCNGIDDDCSGQTDEDYVPITSCFKPGGCATGNVASSCSAGVVTACKTGTPAATDATCNNVDDDCDGSTDENATCDDGDPQTTDTCEAGQCKHVSTVTAGFVKVNAGSFWMGSPGGETCPTGYTGGGCPGSGTAASELGRTSDETLHYVKLTRAFELQAKEVTQGEWQAVFPGWNPSSFASCGTTCPVERVSWYDAVAYANGKSAAAGKTACYTLTSIACEDGTSVSTAADCMTSARGGINVATVALNGAASPYQCTGYRLPTESEWEYAYRAGGSTAFYTSAGNDGTITNTGSDPNADKIAWYYYNDGTTTKPGGGKAANTWGLYDMAGNVWEWCWDWKTTYPSGTVASPAQDPAGGTGSFRVSRGGSWYGSAGFARGADRSGYGPPGSRYNLIGFRLARSL